MIRRRHLIHLEDLLGRRVVAEDGRRVGRIEEVRVDRRGDEYEVSEFLLGTGALFERLSIVQHLFRRQPLTYIARWDQIDITSPDRPRLTCPVEDLKVKRRRSF